MSRIQSYTLKLTHAIVVAGEVITPGNLIDMVEHEAKDLLRRGKAVIADESDAPRTASTEETADAAESDAEGEGNTPPAVEPQKPVKGAKKAGK
ncbi:hypothetical protein AB4076_10955 [Dyella sp. 2RAF44]|uniref:hypothetical protein n=1 Tax=Dyella sp. 2RAF44 TaxID=3233000 RepID=UPI003F8EFE69